MSGYNGWSNYETWLVNLWFGDSWQVRSDIDFTQDYIEEMLDEFRQKMPDWMVDLLGVNFVENEIRWSELEKSAELPEELEEVEDES